MTRGAAASTSRSPRSCPYPAATSHLHPERPRPTPQPPLQPYGWAMPTTTGSSTTDFCAAMLTAAASPLPPDVSRAARRTLLNVLGTTASAAGLPAVTVLLATASGQGSAGRVP